MEMTTYLSVKGDWCARRIASREAARVGTLVDRFGVPWQINCEGAGEPR